MRETNPNTDRLILTQSAYATDTHLAVRMRTHELYSQPQIDFPRWVMSTIGWPRDAWVLDVGAGPGAYSGLVHERVPDGLYLAGDLSLGMARRASAEGVPALNLDVQRLPFADATFDVVLANHMLYHVPDLMRALGELKRVLKPAGLLVAATNSAATMPELETLARRACTLLGYPRQEFIPTHEKFTLENGPIQVARFFCAVARYDLPSALHFPDVEPVMDYLNSMQAIQEPQLPPGVTWDEFMSVMEKQIARLIRYYGELQVQKLTGVIIATNGGGFASEYLHGLNGHGKLARAAVRG
ncbi:MAG: class I SAM-dependent methyltransferase [Anaerolineae bacterium]|nr:class I SAM-dependent methyltransferase [Anaerolineae bacterium]